MLAGYLGVREGEACGLQWKDVDFERNVLCIRGSLKMHDKYKDLYYGETKTESSYRILPIPQNLAVYLRQLKKKQLEQRMLGGSSYNRKREGFVCVDAMGNIKVYFPDLFQKNELRRIRFHDLRHSCATLLLGNGATLKQVQEWLGHHSYVVTADAYGHVLAESKREMADTMSKLLGKERAA